MIYIKPGDWANEPGINVEDSYTGYNGGPTLAVSFPGEFGPDVSLLSPAEADALLIALMRWKLMRREEAEGRGCRLWCELAENWADERLP